MCVCLCVCGSGHVWGGLEYVWVGLDMYGGLEYVCGGLESVYVSLDTRVRV